MEFSWHMPILDLFKNLAILGNFSIFFLETYFCVSKMDIHTNFCDNCFKIEYFNPYVQMLIMLKVFVSLLNLIIFSSLKYPCLRICTNKMFLYQLFFHFFPKKIGKKYCNSPSYV